MYMMLTIYCKCIFKYLNYKNDMEWFALVVVINEIIDSDFIY